MDTKYPIYNISFKWSEPGTPKGIPYDPESNWFKGLPEGRFWNEMSHRIMLKEELTDAELTIKASEMWTQYTTAHPDIVGIDNLVIIGKLVEHESWCLQWFNHYTFDVGQTDAEVLESFENFVNRKQDQNHGKDIMDAGRSNLMGAEDRYRWHGAGITGEPDEHSNPPCRCTACKAQGLIRINH